MKKKLVLFVLAVFTVLTLSLVLHNNVVHAANDVCPDCGKKGKKSVYDNITCSTEDPGTAYWEYVCVNAACANYGMGFYTGTTSPNHLGYKTTSYTAATCETDGKRVSKCSGCGDVKTEILKATGHSYAEEVLVAATCETEGSAHYVCSKCGDEHDGILETLGHDLDAENPVIVDPTCEVEGSESILCTRCDYQDVTVIEALGHDLDTESAVTVDPTCTVEGTISTPCTRCQYQDVVTIEPLGHEIDEDSWVITKPASVFEEGEMTTHCLRCNAEFTKAIPALIPAWMWIAGATAVAIGGAIAAYLSAAAGKAAAKKAGEKIVEELVEEELLKPSMEDKTIMAIVSEYNEGLVGQLKLRTYLSVSRSELDSLAEDYEENEPDLVLVDIANEDYEEVVDSLLELEDCKFSLIVNPEQLKDYADNIEQLKAEKKLLGVALTTESNYVKTVKCVLPALKPNYKSDEALENMGMVADLLGIPYVSTVIDVFTSGREIKETMANDELSKSDIATIVSDMASILGFDTISSVAGLVGDVEDAAAAFDEEAGTNELKAGAEAGIDVVEVISDLLDR